MPTCIINAFDDECANKAKNGPLLTTTIILDSPHPVLRVGESYTCFEASHMAQERRIKTFKQCPPSSIAVLATTMELLAPFQNTVVD